MSRGLHPIQVRELDRFLAKKGFTYTLAGGRVHWRYKRDKWASAVEGVCDPIRVPPTTDYLWQGYVYLMERMMERVKLKVVGGESAPLTDPGVMKTYPKLWAWLTETKYSDGGKRETGTIKLFTGDGSIKAMLKDADNKACLFISGATWKGLWEAVEEALADPEREWKPDRYADGFKPKKGQGR